MLAAGPGSTLPEVEQGLVAAGGRWSAQRIALGVVVALVSVWLFVKAVDDPRRFVVVTLNGTTLAALYFVVASGFTLIFGLMRVVNMAHGSLYLLGGYLALEMQEGWFRKETGSGLGLSLSRRDRHDVLAARLDRPVAARDGDHRRARRPDPAGVPALEPGPGPAPGADHDRALGDPRRPDARRVRRHLEGHQDAERLARQHQRARRALRLLPGRDRARLGAADRRSGCGGSSSARASARSCARASTTATWSPRSASTCS